MLYTTHLLESSSKQWDNKVKSALGTNLLSILDALITWAAEPLFHEQLVFVKSILVIIICSRFLLWKGKIPP